jgi:hypothetical protein
VSGGGAERLVALVAMARPEWQFHSLSSSFAPRRADRP